MTASDPVLVPLRASEIAVGIPLPWALYDRQYQLLRPAGSVLENQQDLDVLVRRGIFRQRSGKPQRESGQCGADAETEGAGGRIIPLDEVHLNIGDPFQLQSQADPGEHRFYVRLVGYLKGKCVLVTAPEDEGKLCLVREGQAFVVRFFSGRNAYAFKASALRSSNVPFPHVFLSYPAQVRALTVRAGERVPVDLICSIAMPEGTNTVNAAGVLTNLSVSGAMVRSRTPLGVRGDPVSVKFRMEIREIEVFAVVDATIRTVSRDESGEFLIGVQFSGLSNELTIALTAFVYKKLAASG